MKSFLDEKLHRQKLEQERSGNERKAVCKNKNKSFHLFLRRKSAKDEKKRLFLTFYSRAKSFPPNFFKERKKKKKLFRSRPREELSREKKLLLVHVGGTKKNFCLPKKEEEED